MIKEVYGRFVCTDCGRKWSAMLGDNEVPEKCDCVLELEASIREGLYDSPECQDFADIHIQTFSECIIEVLKKQGLKIVKEVV